MSAHPAGSRCLISGLRSRDDLNGTEVIILQWNEEKQRYAVLVVAKTDAEQGHLVKPDNLMRAVNPFEKLGDDAVAACLCGLGSWRDAARAAAVRHTWRKLLKDGSAWPVGACAAAPAHWREDARFGSDWKERLPFAKPHFWAAPTPAPSWTWALHGLPGVERLPRLLRWLDVMDATWPGVLIPRWPGMGRRLQWLQGKTATRLTMAALRGNIRREWPPGSGRVGLNAYRDGGVYNDAMQSAPPCAFTLPADAALFFALMPEGFGEEASDGSFVRAAAPPTLAARSVGV